MAFPRPPFRTALGLWLCLALGLPLMSAAPQASAAAQPMAPDPLRDDPIDGRRSPDQSVSPAELQGFIDGVVSDAMFADHIAGESVAVVQDDRIVALRGYGLAGPGEAVDPRRTLFRIGSLSKTFTWIALMKEVERGRVKLDAPVNDYLPPRLKVPSQGFTRPIRVIDLMSHTPGFEDREFGQLSFNRSDQIAPLFDYLVRHRPNRVREPGQVSSYSNYGAALAGAIVSQLNGQDYDTVIEREVISPLGLADTTFREPYEPRNGLPAPMPKAQAVRLSNGYLWTGAGYRPAPIEYITQIGPAGSASTTAADMARYMRLHLAGGVLDGVRIYNDLTAKAFRTPILAAPIGVNGWAHGLMVRPMPGGFASYGHGGATQTFFSNMVLVPDLRLGVFVTTNTDTGRPLADRLPKLIVARFYADGAPIAAAPGDPALAKIAGNYAGPYVSTRRAYSGLEAFVDLMDGHDAVSVTPAGYLITRVGGVAETWVPDHGTGSFKSVRDSSRLQFKLDRGGRAVSFPGARGTFTLERAGLLLDPRLFQTAAALVLAASMVIWIGYLAGLDGLRRETAWQARATVVSLGVATLWVWAFAAFWVWASGRGPIEGPWPGVPLLNASIAALTASVGSLVLLAMTPLCCRQSPERAPGDWSVWRKGGHMLISIVFVLFAGLVAVRGGLTPWA